VSGVEALVRWIHPQRGLIPPNDFIPMAEQTGVMRPLTLWVLEEALSQSRRWLDAGRPLEVAVNVSATNLLDDAFRPDVKRLLAESGVPAELLRLEITENVLMSDPLRAREVIAALSDLGVEVSLDDFGTGFSSLSYLHELAVDELKIDRSFVIGMSESEGDSAIVRSVVDLARNLGITIVAEGVEDEPTLEALAGFGCDLVQGFFLSRPLPAADLDAWLEEREAGMLTTADSAPTHAPL
jgi:EAL domain-containing protein (putative c-di-GMP-specific phosphodiesterase class I)